MLELALVIAGVILVFATITDIRSTEVPDWLSYAGIAAGIGLHSVLAITSWSVQPLISLGLGLLIFVPLGLLMYYAGQWGGGDSKLMMALGALFGLSFSMSHFSVAFLINTLLAGALYGLGSVAFIAARNYAKIAPVYGTLAKQKPMLIARLFSMLAAIALILVVVSLDIPVRAPLLILAGLLPLLTYSLLVTKAVEQCCMLKTIPPSELREGDWIVKDVVVAGKRITGPKDLGVTKEQIAELQRLSKKHTILVEIKNGIPFVPSFLLAFVLTVWIGNPLLLF